MKVPHIEHLETISDDPSIQTQIYPLFSIILMDSRVTKILSNLSIHGSSLKRIKCFNPFAARTFEN